MRARGAAASAVLATCTVLLTGCMWDFDWRLDEGIVDRETDAAFYTLPETLPPGDPGSIIRSESIDTAPIGTRAWRVIYHSRDLAGKDIPVSGTVIVPDLPAPDGGRVVVAWGHPTTGIAQKCAPSVAVDPFEYIEGMDALLAEGYAVVSTDYPGMGVAGDSSYLIGVTTSNGVLDGIRAARALPDLTLSERVLLWGHSQGGHAALFSAQRAPEYAPELIVEAVAVAAPAAELTTLLTDDIGDIAGVSITSYAITAFTSAYSDRYSQDELLEILTPAGRTATPTMAELCLLTENKELHAIAGPLVGGYVTSDPSTTEPWKTILTENNAGAEPIGVPIMIGQGLADTLVIPTATEGFVAQLCAAGESVQFTKYPGVTHGLAAYATLPEVVPWFADILAGKVAPSNC